jgi:hypothetical protein
MAAVADRIRLGSTTPACVRHPLCRVVVLPEGAGDDGSDGGAGGDR